MLAWTKMLRAALVGFEYRQGQEFLLFSVGCRLTLWSTQPLVQWVSRAVPSRVKRQKHEANQHLHAVVELYLLCPMYVHGTMLNYVLKQRVNSTFNTKMYCRSASSNFICISHVTASETCCMTFKLFWINFPRNPNTKPNNFQPPNMGRARNSFQSIHSQNPPSRLSAYESWKRLEQAAEFCHYTIATTSSSTFKSTEWPSVQLHVYTSTEIPQLYYRQDPRLAHKLNCTCSLLSNISVNNSFQPAATEPVNSETGISSPAHNIPTSPPPPATGDEPNSLRSAQSWPEQRDTLLTRNKAQHTRGRNTIQIILSTIYCSRLIACINTAISLHETRKLTHRISN
jgi:hypothetical protein